MSYTPNTWATGDTITAEKLNNMEQGIAGAGEIFLVSLDMNMQTGTVALGKTWQEIYDAMKSGKMAFIVASTEDDPTMGDACNAMPVMYAFGPVPQTGGGVAYGVLALSVDMSGGSIISMRFATTSADDYPTLVMSN